MPRITLRDLFWLIVVVGLSLGWWLDRRWLAEHTHTNLGGGSGFVVEYGPPIESAP